MRYRFSDLFTERLSLAEQKARKLLLRHLSAEQLEMYKQVNGLVVKGPSGKYYFVTAHSFYLIRGTSLVRYYCLEPSKEMPEEDWLLAKILLLQGAEDYALRTAYSETCTIDTHFLRRAYA